MGIKRFVVFGYFLCSILGLLTFFVVLRIANFFIPPKDHWTKSGFTMLMTKVGMAFTASVYVALFIYMFLFA